MAGAPDFWFPGRWIGGVSLVAATLCLLAGVLLRAPVPFFFSDQLTAFSEHPLIGSTAKDDGRWLREIRLAQFHFGEAEVGKSRNQRARIGLVGRDDDIDAMSETRITMKADGVAADDHVAHVTSVQAP